MKQKITALSPATAVLYAAVLAKVEESVFLHDAGFTAAGDDEADMNGFSTKRMRIGFHNKNKQAFLDWVQERADEKGLVATDWLCGLDYPRVGCNIDKAVLTSTILLGRSHEHYNSVVEALVREFLLYISKVITKINTVQEV